jgi:hypothetical protein
VPPNRATLGVFGECARRGPPFRGCDVVVGGAEVVGVQRRGRAAAEDVLAARNDSMYGAIFSHDSVQAGSRR